MKQTALQHTQNILLILLGSFIFSTGVNYFGLANRLSEGGFTGIAMITHYVFDWSPGIVSLVMNIPLLIIGYKVFGKRTLVYTLLAILFSSLFLHISQNWGQETSETLLAALYTGVMVGIGLGIIYRAGGTTGGTLIIARFCHHWFGWSIGRTMFLLDFAVIVGSIQFIGLEKGMYTLVAVFIGIYVMDYVIEGLSVAKAATIITNEPQQLSQEITRRLKRGVTFLQGRGGYTGYTREVLYVIVSPTQLPRLKEIVHQVDPYAFVVVNDAREVLGEGFTYSERIKMEKQSQRGAEEGS